MDKLDNLDDLDSNALFYGGYYEILRSAADAIVGRLAPIEKLYADADRPYPVEHFKVRIKTADSARAKLTRLGLPATLESAQENLFDLVGVRLVCRFFNDVYAISRILQELEGVEVYTVKDYVKNPKPNGYRSVHIILRVPVARAGGEGGVYMQCVEVQIRTIAMDFWASMEHELKYKNHVPDTELMSAELKRCADEIISVDMKMQTIYEWLSENGEPKQSLDAPAKKSAR